MLPLAVNSSKTTTTITTTTTTTNNNNNNINNNNNNSRSSSRSSSRTSTTTMARSCAVACSRTKPGRCEDEVAGRARLDASASPQEWSRFRRGGCSCFRPFVALLRLFVFAFLVPFAPLANEASVIPTVAIVVLEHNYPVQLFVSFSLFFTPMGHTQKASTPHAFPQTTGPQATCQRGATPRLRP